MLAGARYEFDIVTPIHNEESRVKGLVSSIRSLASRPRKWCIVDDHSTDQSVSLLRDSVRELDYVMIVERDSPGPAGWMNTGAVMQYGIDALANTGEVPDFIAIVDADVVLNPDYFERIIAKIKGRPEIVIAAGLLADVDKDGQSQERRREHLRWLPRGAARIYRYEFLKSVGGFPRCPSSDDALVIKAKNRGLRFEVVPEAKGLHVRRTGDMRRDLRNFGLSSRINGLDWLSMFVVFFSSMRRHGGGPALAFAQGYLSKPDVKSAQTDPEVYAYFRHAWRQTIRAFFEGKKASS